MSRQKIEELILLENNTRYILRALDPSLFFPDYTGAGKIQLSAEAKAKAQLSAFGNHSELAFLETRYSLEKQILKSTQAFRTVSEAQKQIHEAGEKNEPGKDALESVIEALRKIYVANAAGQSVGVKINANPSQIISRINQMKEVLRSYGKERGENVAAALNYIDENLKIAKPRLPFSYKGFISIDLLAADYFEGKFFVNPQKNKGVTYYRSSKPNLDDLLKSENKPFLNIDWKPIQKGAGKAASAAYAALGTGLKYIGPKLGKGLCYVGRGIVKNAGGLAFVVGFGAILTLVSISCIQEYNNSLMLPDPVPVRRCVENPHTKPTPQIQPTPHLTPADSNLVYNKK